MTVDIVREKQLNIRLNSDEEARFQRLADHFGVSVPTMVRMLVKEKERELGLGSVDSKPSRKK